MATRIIVETQREDGTWRIVKKLKNTDRGMQVAFLARNKKLRKNKKARVRIAELNRKGRVLRKWVIGQAQVKHYPFEGSPKDSAGRRSVYDAMTQAFSGRHTSGDRPTKYTASGNISDHWIGATSSWGEDYGWNYWTQSGRTNQVKAEAWLRSHYSSLKLKQVYSKPHGSGPHIHVAGRV